MELTLVTKPGPDTEELDVGGLVAKHLKKKLEKIEHRIGGTGLTARGVFAELSVGFEATITIQGKEEFVGKAKEPELLRAVDAALDKITRQVEAQMDRNTGKARARRSSGTRRSIV